ncbi:MAG: MoxR family ATPase [Burkholderiaceae bacterium]
MHSTREAAPTGVDETVAWLRSLDYVCDRRLATSIFLSIRLGRPLFLEGEAGVGKTEIAKVLSSGLGVPLIRLQCYEGIDINQAAYEWNVARQMLEIRLAEAGRGHEQAARLDLYRRDLLVERPLLAALSGRPAPVLLIDELDRADEPFEAFLLEILSDFQMTIPEYGVVRADEPPVVVLTSNRTREIHDALKRRCLYAWVDYPTPEQELEIVRRKAPGAAERLSRQVVDFVQRSRDLDLFKSPGVAETLDWTNALTALNVMSLDPTAVNDTLGVLLKYQEDLSRLQGAEVDRILDEMRALSGHE